MTRIFFVLNDFSEFGFQEQLARHLPGVTVDVGTSLPPTPSDYRLILLWNVRRIIKNLPSPNNVILFHSSDLPKGKGWAPIYYAIAEGHSQYVISGIFAAPKIDSGDIIVKARFRMPENCAASDLRRFDMELSILLLKKILDRFEGRAIVGTPQRGESTSRPRRTPEDNRIDMDLPFRALIPHFLACEPAWPAYFECERGRFTVEIVPAEKPEFSKEIEIEFGEDAPKSDCP